MARQVRFVRGRVRQLIADIRRDLVSLLAYDEKQPAGTFLTSQQREDAQSVSTDMLVLLEAKKTR